MCVAQYGHGICTTGSVGAFASILTFCWVIVNALYGKELSWISSKLPQKELKRGSAKNMLGGKITERVYDNCLSIFLSKQELYFVKENYEIFSTEVSAREKQGQNSGWPHQGVIVSLWILSVVRPFWICLPVGKFLSRNVPCSSLFIVQFLLLPSSCEVSLRKLFQKTPGKCRTSWVYE